MWCYGCLTRCGVNHQESKNIMKKVQVGAQERCPVVQDLIKFISTVIDSEGTFVFVRWIDLIDCTREKKGRRVEGRGKEPREPVLTSGLNIITCLST